MLLPASGEPILLMSDRQTTGGHPQIAVVITADIPLAAQLAPGDWIELEACSLEDAERALANQEGSCWGPAPGGRSQATRPRSTRSPPPGVASASSAGRSFGTGSSRSLRPSGFPNSHTRPSWCLPRQPRRLSLPSSRSARWADRRSRKPRSPLLLRNQLPLVIRFRSPHKPAGRCHRIMCFRPDT